MSILRMRKVNQNSNKDGKAKYENQKTTQAR